MKSNRIFDKIIGILFRVVLLVNTIMVVYPLLWTILTSFKTNTEILGNPWVLPKSVNIGNYVSAFTKANIGSYSINSVLVTAGSIILLVTMAVSSAYALARYEFPFRKFIKNIYMGGIFIQITFIIIPLFLLMTRLHMNDNRFWLSLVYAVSQLPFSIYLLISFMKGIPKDYENSAMIDGCGYAGAFIRIIVPLAKPGIITVTIFSFFAFWNEFPLALTLISTDTKKTLPIGLANLMEVQRYATDWGALFAGLVIVLVPTIIVFVLTQDKLTKGMQLGGLKG
ncbi:carbohydrate ABC transporter permease [Ruminiclostridium cellobioparum]|jgi:N-acetylglucosamine transport system permease protein|uniref:ABC-type sugar transport system, permease component n=2 Tax=Ruminiclostridium cellobioparum TaxID=29355 RepID=S0FSH6_RUMCE|nr:carbohydrate ABC transporter permease [Ruminiclostridium cellobioparum]EMS72139.1 ABC-type sugar transport system, permease component [Ruminiclostridium cellobioparum subsp. termitidis CT1112]